MRALDLALGAPTALLEIAIVVPVGLALRAARAGLDVIEGVVLVAESVHALLDREEVVGGG